MFGREISVPVSTQLSLFETITIDDGNRIHEALKPPSQLLKWVGNKQRFAPEITRYIPRDFCLYIEPFVGTGAVLGALGPGSGLAGDTLKPLIGIWHLVKDDPETLVASYEEHRRVYMLSPKETYLAVRESYNRNPNPLDLLFISRSCYGGVVRFTREGTISTPIGPHTPIPAGCATLSSMRLPVFRKPTVSASEWEKIESDAQAAQELLSQPRFQFLRDYLANTQASITDIFVQNRLKDVTETVYTRDQAGAVTFKKTLKTTRKEQEYELSGQYQFISRLLSDLETTAKLADDYRKQADEGRIVIESSVEHG